MALQQYPCQMQDSWWWHFEQIGLVSSLFCSLWCKYGHKYIAAWSFNILFYVKRHFDIKEMAFGTVKHISISNLNSVIKHIFCITACIQHNGQYRDGGNVKCSTIVHCCCHPHPLKWTFKIHRNWIINCVCRSSNQPKWFSIWKELFLTARADLKGRVISADVPPWRSLFD